MTLEELFTAYGKATVQLELAQNQFNEIKRQLADAINKENEAKAKVLEPSNSEVK